MAKAETRNNFAGLSLITFETLYLTFIFSLVMYEWNELSQLLVSQLR